MKRRMPVDVEAMGDLVASLSLEERYKFGKQATDAVLGPEWCWPKHLRPKKSGEDDD